MKHITNIEKNLIQRFAMMLFLCIIGIVNVQAEGQFDIYFRSCEGKDDPNALRTQIDSILRLDTYNNGYVESIEAPIYIYNSNSTLQLGAKMGRSHELGSMTINLAKKCQIRSSKLAFYLAHYYDFDSSRGRSDDGPLKVTVTYTDGTTTAKVITIEEWADGKTLNEHKVGFHNHQTMILHAEKYIQKIKLETTQKDTGRVYCKYFTIFSAPTPSTATVATTQTTATITCPGITDLGSEHFSVIDYGFVFSQSNTNPTIGAEGVTKYQIGTSYSTTNTPFYTTLSDLIPGTTYYVRPYVVTTQLNVDNNDICTAYCEQTTAFNTRGYMATFDAGAYGTCATPTIEEISNTAGITLPSVTPKSGYRFLGWSTSNSVIPPDTLQSGANFNLTNDMTFYAVYIQQFTVQWLVDRENYTVGNPTTIVDKGAQVDQLPKAPTPEDRCGNTFVGWTDTEIIATQDNRPAILFTTKAESPPITHNTIFYAVFADKIE